MNFSELRGLAFQYYAPALYLETVFPVHMRRMVKSVLTVMLFALIALYGLGIVSSRFAGGSSSLALGLYALGPQIAGLMAIVLAVRLFIMALDFFSHSFFFQDLDLVLEQHTKMPQVTTEAALVIYKANPADPLSGLFRSEIGLESLARIGILPDEAMAFDRSARPHLNDLSFDFPVDTPLSLSHLVGVLYAGDKNFQDFLFQHGVQMEDLKGAVEWVEESHRQDRQKARWWSKDELGRVPGIGKDWAYGEIYYLERYARDMVFHPAYRGMTAASKLGSKEVKELETILARARESNALLVGEAGGGVIDTVARLTHEIQDGHILPPLEGKRVFLFNGETLVAESKEKGRFEENFMRTMQQTIAAGNIILVFENFPEFIKSAEALGVNVVEVLHPYLTSPGVQIIATSTPEEFHNSLERNGAMMELFEVVQMSAAEGSAVLDVVKRYARHLERTANVFFTYQSVVEIMSAADQYIPYGVMPDKAVDLITEIVPSAVQRGKPLVEKKDVQAYISTKTGVPVGEVGGAERSLLIDLEKTLEARVIGQPEAAKAVASAMRRARAGTRSTKRPMGTFLFLGPTGVGKTETAKALAELFFKKPDAVIRIQMPEFTGPDALDRLIGTFEGGKAGILSSALKERPYGVLLLDEFEKTTDAVLNLFLQILDEGQFADAAGKRVDARNVIMIATSNAGADLIWEYFKKNESPSDHRDELVDNIIKRGVFKPELLNRFDGVIVFNPLKEEVVRKIARLQLESLGERMKKKGIEYIVSDAAVDAVVKAGYQPEFGARAMNRAITEKVEQLLADKMIRGDIKSGMKVELGEKDFAV